MGHPERSLEDRWYDTNEPSSVALGFRCFARVEPSSSILIRGGSLATSSSYERQGAWSGVARISLGSVPKKVLVRSLPLEMPFDRSVVP